MSEEFLGVYVEPREVAPSKNDRIRDALYGFDNRCVVTEDSGYQELRFDTLSFDEFAEYFDQIGQEKIFVTGYNEQFEALIDRIDASEAEIVFDEYTLRGPVHVPGKSEVFADEIKSLFPHKDQTNLVEEGTRAERLEKLGVSGAEVVHIDDVAQPPSDSLHY